MNGDLCDCEGEGEEGGRDLRVLSCDEGEDADTGCEEDGVDEDDSNFALRADTEEGVLVDFGREGEGEGEGEGEDEGNAEGKEAEAEEEEEGDSILET